MHVMCGHVRGSATKPESRTLFSESFSKEAPFLSGYPSRD